MPVCGQATIRAPCASRLRLARCPQRLRRTLSATRVSVTDFLANSASNLACNETVRRSVQSGRGTCRAPAAGSHRQSLLSTTAAAVEQCRAAVSTLRSCVQAATSRLDSCCALLRAAGAAVAALEQACGNAAEVGSHQLRQLHSLSAAMLAATDMAVACVQVTMAVKWRSVPATLSWRAWCYVLCHGSC